MAKISDAEIARYARSAGVTGDNVAIAVAIALAESGGNTTSHNPIPPDDSYGLWQINMLGSLGPDRRRQFGLSSNSQLYDPATNARAMYSISGGGKNWKPWTTYTSGKYRMFMPRATAAAGSSGGSTTVPVSNPVTDGFGNLSKIFHTLSDPKTWIRIGLFLAGFVLLIVALFRFTGDNKLSEGTKAIAKFVAVRKL